MAIKIPNLKDIMISISDFKQQLADIISKDMTKVIIKNNEPVSVIMPYSDYISLVENAEENKKLLYGTGQDITMKNGVQVMVVVETSGNKIDTEELAIKTYVKMKSSGDYKLHYTLHLSPPSVEQTLTTDELVSHYLGDLQKE